MKTKFYLKTMLLLWALVAGSVGTMWAENADVTTTYIFTNRDWNATCNNADANWTCNDRASGYTEGQGTQITSSANGANATSPVSFTNVKKITVTYCTNSKKGEGIIKVKVGDGTEQSFDVYAPSSGGTTLKTTEFTFSPTETGAVTLTVNCLTNSIYIYSIAITTDGEGGDEPSEPTTSNLALTNAPIALSFDLYNNASAQTINYTTSSTGAVTIDDNDYASFSIDQTNKTITVTPTAVTPSTQTITVNQAADNTYAAGSVTFTFSISDSTPTPTHTATFSVNGTTSTEELEEGAAITFPENPASIDGKVFMGWVSTAIVGTTNDAPSFITSATMGESDVTYYAVFATAEESSATLKQMKKGDTFADGDRIVITALTDKDNDVWLGMYQETISNSYVKNYVFDGSYSSVIADDKNWWTVSAGSDGKWILGDATNGYLYTSGSNNLSVDKSNYSEWTLEESDPNSDEFKLKSGRYLSCRTDLTSDNANLFRMAGSSLAGVYCFTIYKLAGGTTYSDYCTTVVATAVKKPVITVDETFVGSTTATITCETEDATIYYRYSENGEWMEYSPTFALTITETTTIFAKAVKGNDESEVVSKTTTKLLPVATPTFTPAEGTYSSVQNVTISCTTENATIYYSFDSETWYEYTEPLTISETTTIYAKAEKEGMVASEVASATYTIEIPSIVFDGQQNPMNIAYTAGETNVHYVASYTTGTITLVLCDANGDPIGPSPYDWLTPQITSNVYVHVTWQANEDTENARTTYFKLKADNVESEVFRIMQAKYVPDFATLPFSYDGGRNGIAETCGLTQEGLGADYASSPYLKFDGKDDNVILKINERPGTLTFDIKGNSFSGGTFKVQTSEDGTTYTDLATYTELGDKQNEVLKNLDENVRYIKWVYTEKSSGNVALGNINLAQYVEPEPSITVDPDEVEVDAEEHNGTLAITYQKMNLTSREDFTVHFYDSDANALADIPSWLEVLVAEEQSGGYVVSYSIGENSDNERTAYFKVYAMNGQVPVYSNMVTITQAAYVAPVPTTTYTLATTITSGKHYIITNGEDKAMGLDRGSNRHAVDIDINEGTATVASDGDVYEVAIYGPYTIEGKSCYTIYDEKTQGYLLAASSSNNYLKTKSILDANGNWTIDIASDGVATIKAQGSNTRNWMRYNYNSGSSPLFSCYGSGLDDIYLFERSDDNGSGTAEVSIASACTDGTKYYGTYSSTESFVAPTDVTVSEISLEDGKLVLHDFTTGSLIPANTGVLVSSETAGTKTLTQATGGSSILGTANCLRPTGAGITADDMAVIDAGCKFYRLTMHNGTDIGFWWGAADGAAFDVAPNKAYLALPATAAVRSGYSWTDETTGIGAVLSETENNGIVYDLQGRRVSKPASGLYIKNGKKVVVK